MVNVQEPGTDLLAESLDELAICGGAGQVGLKGAIFFETCQRMTDRKNNLLRLLDFHKPFSKVELQKRVMQILGSRGRGGQIDLSLF